MVRISIVTGQLKLAVRQKLKWLFHRTIAPDEGSNPSHFHFLQCPHLLGQLLWSPHPSCPLCPVEVSSIEGRGCFFFQPLRLTHLDSPSRCWRISPFLAILRSSFWHCFGPRHCCLKAVSSHILPSSTSLRSGPLTMMKITAPHSFMCFSPAYLFHVQSSL